MQYILLHPLVQVADLGYAYRFGCAIVILGVIGMVVFLAANQSNVANYAWFCLSTLLLAAGGVMMYRNLPPQPPSPELFRLLKSKDKKIKSQEEEKMKGISK
jgi:hypothetical protein